MIDTYPDTLAAMEVHLSSTDPYTTAWGSMRAGLYSFGYIPHSVQDGLYKADPYPTYESKFLVRQAIATDVTIEMTVMGAGGAWNVSALVCIEAGGAPKTMKIWMARMLDHYGPVNFERNMVRDGSDATEITLAPAECATVTKSFVILDAPSLSSPENVKFFAWAQDPVYVWDPTSPPIGAAFAEVYQASKALAPFEGVFVDGFEAGDTSKWSAVSP